MTRFPQKVKKMFSSLGQTTGGGGGDFISSIIVGDNIFNQDIRSGLDDLS